MTIPQWAITDDGNQHIVDVPDPAHRLSSPEPVTVTPGTDKKPTSLIACEAAERLAELEATTSYNVDIIDPPNAWVDGYQAGYAAAWQASGAHYYLDHNGDGNYTRKATR